MWRCLIILLLTTTAVAQTSRPAMQPVDATLVEQLITALGADEAADRAAAEDKLATLGPSILPLLLTAAERNADPEVRSRLESLITTLKRADRSGPTLVTLRSKGVPPRAALDKIREQTGVDVSVWPPGLWRHGAFKPVTLEVENQPFWIVLMSLCDQGGLDPQQRSGYGSGDRIVLSSSTPLDSPRPQSYHDGFLFVPETGTRTHTINYNQGEQASSVFQIAMKVLVDPKTRVLQGPSGLGVTEAVDENGLSLAMKAPQPWMSGMTQGGSQIWGASATLQWDPQQGKQLKRFKGSAAFDVIDELETWEIDVANFKRVEKKLPKITYAVESFLKENRSYRVKVSLSFPKGTPMNQLNQNAMNSWQTVSSLLKLVDDKGAALAGRGGGGGGGLKTTYEMNFAADQNAGPVGEPAKIIWTLPITTRKIEVPFEFKDLPIP